MMLAGVLFFLNTPSILAGPDQILGYRSQALVLRIIFFFCWQVRRKFINQFIMVWWCCLFWRVISTHSAQSPVPGSNGGITWRCAIMFLSVASIDLQQYRFCCMKDSLWLLDCFLSHTLYDTNNTCSTGKVYFDSPLCLKCWKEDGVRGLLTFKILLMIVPSEWCKLPAALPTLKG